MFDPELLKVYKEVLGKDLIQESVGDNKIDNLVDELKRSTELELSMFVVNLLNSAFGNFASNYQTALHEGFKTVINVIVERFRVMDDFEKQDLFQKIEILFKDLMVKNYNALGAETAELVASRYAKQMIDYLKGQNKDPQKPIDDLYLNNDEIHPKAKDEIDIVALATDSQEVGCKDLFNNPY